MKTPEQHQDDEHIGFVLHVLACHTRQNGIRYGRQTVDMCAEVGEQIIDKMTQQQRGEFRMLMGFLQNMRDNRPAPKREVQVPQEVPNDFPRIAETVEEEAA